MNATRPLVGVLLLSGALVIAIAAWGTRPAEPAGPSTSRRAEVEADWLRQDVVRRTGNAAITAVDDAAGAVDGVKDGKWGFHTSSEAEPWWQVDLGAPVPLARTVVYNRGDAPARAYHLRLLLSDDGKAWRVAYQHDGSHVGSALDGKPLAVQMAGHTARFVRVQLPGTEYLHLDEVEVYGAADPARNLAVGKPADQSSASMWSARHHVPGKAAYDVAQVFSRGHRLLADLGAAGLDTRPYARELAAAEATCRGLTDNSPVEARRKAYVSARWAVRRLALANPLLGFDRILFVKRVPGSFSHMSDQNYGWWSRPGGGIFVLEGFRSDAPRVRNLTPSLAAGSCLSPDLSPDGRKVLFAWCKYYPWLAAHPDKENKANVPEDAFYHLFEMNVDGTGLRQITRGKYDDFDGRYLPGGEIAFLSTRRGRHLQAGQATAMASMNATLPDSYVRCGGGPERPVAVYTLHTLDAGRTKMRAISPFESFEWTPSVAADGRIMYARWDYVDRDNMPYMKLWAVNPDGSNPQIVYGNHTRSPHCTFEARSVPGSSKVMFTASAHHSITGGSLAMLDPTVGTDGQEALTRLTPEVCFPEIEGWPASYYASPYPLSERHWLTAWSPEPLGPQSGINAPSALGIYLGDAYGNLELLYRDRDISSLCPIPLRSREAPPMVARAAKWDAPQEPGTVVVANVYQGLAGVTPGTVKALRIVGMPLKTQPPPHVPPVGQTRDDPGKFVLGTVPVEPDGSAHFQVPSGVPVFFQALDERGYAVQTMRSLTCVQPNQTMACGGCHEPRNVAPPNAAVLALRRPPSKMRPGPGGSWPYRFDHLVQPVLDRACASCHGPGGHGGIDLTPAQAYNSLVLYGSPNLRDHVVRRYAEGRSAVNGGAAQTSALMALLDKGHHGVALTPDQRDRLATWMDTYAQVQGHFSSEQEEDLVRLRRQCQALMDAR